MWYEFCLITDRSIVQVDHFSGQSVTNKDKMFTKTFTPRKHQAAQYNTTEHLSPVPFQSLACAVCILIPFNQSSFLNLFLSAFTCTILPIACLNSTEDFGHVLQQKSNLYVTRPDKDFITYMFAASYAIIKTVSKDRLSIKKNRPEQQKVYGNTRKRNRRNELFRPVEMLFT